MQALRVLTANGIHDIKLIGENEQERLFIKQSRGRYSVLR
jgi:hypothetical protein